MRKILTRLLLMLSLTATTLPGFAADKVQPFVLGSVRQGAMGDVVASVKNSLMAQGFRLVGEYSPYDDALALAVTSDELLSIAARPGGSPYVAVWRVSVTSAPTGVQVGYVNPDYLHHAYRMEESLAGVANALTLAVGRQETFGATGIAPSKLRKYHYTFGMEYYDDFYKLARHDGHAAAVAAFNKGLAAGRYGITKIYELDIPGTDLTLFGVAMKAPNPREEPMDDVYQMGVVDFKELRQTAYLPYEVLVKGDRIEALHMRFRMAVHFPDLRMVGDNSFLHLVKSPDAINKALTLTAGGVWIGEE